MKIKIKKEELKIIFPIMIISFCIIQILNLLSPAKSDTNYSYQIEQSADYKVYLKKNDFIEKEYLEKNLVYLQGIVDYIDFDFSYHFFSFSKTPLDYHYDIIATLFIDSQNSNQNLLTKEYEIVKNRAFYLEQSDKITIQEKINIPYQDYNAEVTRFKENFNIAIKAYLKLDFIVSTNILLDPTSPTTKTTVSESKIELAQSTFEIYQEKIGDTATGMQIIETTNEEKNYRFSFFVLLLLFSLLLLILQIRKNNNAKQSIYELELSVLLRRYRTIIVELKDELILDNFKIIQVKEFDELLDIEEEIRKPILFYETPDKTAVFTILEDSTLAFQYCLIKPH